jgi:hypothetical protein
MVGRLGDQLAACVDGFVLWQKAGTSPPAEACLMHARVLIEFLVGDERRAGDIWPTDYVPDWSVDDATKERFDRWLATVDRLLPDLTLARVDDELTVHLDYQELVESLVDLMGRYAERAGAPVLTGAVAIVRGRLATAAAVRTGRGPPTRGCELWSRSAGTSWSSG